ncbi:hypothetical protein B0H13DRAFT_1010133 [Mycena leptocephala]|nr:hypothetical protein B0H13DRAFT_1010133 [Mycena leptocephala]
MSRDSLFVTCTPLHTHRRRPPHTCPGQRCPAHTHIHTYPTRSKMHAPRQSWLTQAGTGRPRDVCPPPFSCTTSCLGSTSPAPSTTIYSCSEERRPPFILHPPRCARRLLGTHALRARSTRGDVPLPRARVRHSGARKLDARSARRLRDVGVLDLLRWRMQQGETSSSLPPSSLPAPKLRGMHVPLYVHPPPPSV